MWCAVSSVQCGLRSAKRAVCSYQGAVCSVKCAVCSVQCALCGVQRCHLPGFLLDVILQSPTCVPAAQLASGYRGRRMRGVVGAQDCAGGWRRMVLAGRDPRESTPGEFSERWQGPS